MDCKEIKSLLAEKDLEIKLRNEKTYEYFDLIKDDVIEYLIKEHIEDEFSGKYHYFHGRHLVGIIYNKLGIDNRYFTWSFWSCDLEKINLNSYRPDPSYCAWKSDNQELYEDFVKNVEKHKSLEGTYDFKLLGSLVINHIKKSGFQQEVIESRSTGRKTPYLAFKISRNALENNCCESQGNFSFNMAHNDDVPSKEVVIVGIVAIAVLIVISFLFIFN